MCIYNTISCLLPKYILWCIYYHKDENNINFNIYEYLYNYNRRIYNFKFIDSSIYIPIYNINIKDINNINLINHCCIMHQNNYIKDITLEIKKFIHLRNVIKWKYILKHLYLTEYDIILINLNDNELSEKQFYISDLIKNDKIFTF